METRSFSAEGTNCLHRGFDGNRYCLYGRCVFDERVTTLENLKKLDFALVLPGHGAPF